MRLVDRYILRELAASVAATAAVLLLVSLSGVLADLMSKIARGKVPAALLLSQLGLRLVEFAPMLVPLALFLGVLLAVGRLYRDSEMAVLASAGLGWREMLRPLLWLTIPLALAIGGVTGWGAPAALDLSQKMIEAANRSLLVVGLEPGRFIELPGRHSVVYIGEMSGDGSRFSRLFVHSERDGRIDVVTARSGELFSEGNDERYLALTEGFRVEGVPGQSDYRVMRFARNDIRVPDSEQVNTGTSEERTETLALFEDDAPGASAELHWRLAIPLSTIALALLALPLARSPPRATRYGRLLSALLGYIIYFSMLSVGRTWLADGTVPQPLGLWWIHLPMFALTGWLLWSDGRMPARARR